MTDYVSGRGAPEQREARGDARSGNARNEGTANGVGGAEAMLPLADPVVGAIFSDVESAGRAAASLVGAVLAEDGDAVGEVHSVTPQRYYKQAGERGCRIDIEITTRSNERVIVEVQTSRDGKMLHRNLFAASRVFAATARPGTTAAQMAERMPRVIAVNLLDFAVREDNRELLQPVKLMYAKPPHRVALERFAVYNVQMPRVPEAAADFSDRLYCWAYMFYTATSKRMSIKEVVEMTPELQDFAKWDEGFRQYCEQYDRVASDPETREEYYRWIDEQMRQEGMVEAATLDGMAKGRIEGEIKAKIKDARNFLAMGLTPEQVAQGTGLPVAAVEDLTRRLGAMTPELQDFAKWDEGFRQYCEQYDRVASDPETREEYYRWIDEQMRQEGMVEAATLDGMAKGKIDGQREAKLEVARNLFAMGLTTEQVAQGTGLPVAEVEGLARKLEP
ncbi:MAG: PD-(D/E)XK nuclease family transposase [Acidobacteriota bacterium]|jgi:predicted transposase/invertase (TIGR01784 family)|nr:PD-(D/E)XK nuclease family transposase [Acidobacteriota bacterium]